MPVSGEDSATLDTTWAACRSGGDSNVSGAGAGPITGGRVVPCCSRNSSQGGSHPAGGPHLAGGLLDMAGRWSVWRLTDFMSCGASVEWCRLPETAQEATPDADN